MATSGGSEERRAALSQFWFIYFAGVGVFFPYFALYLSENAGLAGSQVGIVLALFPLVGLLAQPLWGQIADRTGERGRVLAVVSAGAAVGYALLPRAHGFAQVLAATAFLALFVTAAVPLAVAVSMAALARAGSHRFGLVRVWGSVGFLISIALFPPLLAATQEGSGRSPVAASPSEPGLALMFPLTAVLCVIAAGLALRLPRGGAVGLRAAPGEWRALVRGPEVRRLCGFAFGAFLFSQGPMVLFPVYVRSLGGDMHTVSRMWLVMLAVEIPLILWSGPVLRRCGARLVLGVGLAAGSLRWLACGLGPPLVVVYAVQLLHGVAVTGLLLGGPFYLELVVPERLRSTAQSLYSMVGIGVGGAVSSALAGWLADRFDVRAPYLLAGAGGLLLAAAVTLILPRLPHGDAPQRVAV